MSNNSINGNKDYSGILEDSMSMQALGVAVSKLLKPLEITIDQSVVTTMPLPLDALLTGPAANPLSSCGGINLIVGTSGVQTTTFTLNKYPGESNAQMCRRIIDILGLDKVTTNQKGLVFRLFASHGVGEATATGLIQLSSDNGNITTGAGGSDPTQLFDNGPAGDNTRGITIICIKATNLTAGSEAIVVDNNQSTCFNRTAPPS